jgi:hypothetical protein
MGQEATSGCLVAGRTEVPFAPHAGHWILVLRPSHNIQKAF